LKCFIILPCYNEEENLEKLLKSIDKNLRDNFPYHVIAVNDGSSDRTGETLRRLSLKYPITTVEHSRNRGLSEALKTGFKTVLGKLSDEDYVVVMDSDNTHDPKYIPLMIHAANNFEVVIGSRYVKNGKQVNVPPHRVLMSWTVNRLIGLLLKVNIKDFTSGYRCFKASTIKKLFNIFGEKLIESNGFEVSLEILLKTLACKSKIGEIPITLNYGLKNGRSKMKSLPTIFKYMRLLLNLKNKLRKIIREKESCRLFFPNFSV